MFRRVLIANRGEVALRIVRTLREMDIRSLAVFSDVDRYARYVLEADEAYYLGAAPASASYLNADAILEAAVEARADAIHPGYGFLAENAAFAQAVAGAGFTFIGPSPTAIRLMGDKVQARDAVQKLGVPLVPGTAGPVRTVDEALSFAGEAGYPVAVKAAGGGGGRGIRVVTQPGEMAVALDAASREAEAYFKSADIYVERYFSRPRHVEIQVLGDTRGALVHLGERDCSIQRRHQKLIEETPSPAVNRELRSRMGDAALRAAAGVGYSSAGTVEFLLTETGEFYFLEMNTRIQVEHPITEEVSGVDLIREMILAAAGDAITVTCNLLDPRGHAIEVRINAEDPLHGFRPTPAPVTGYREPGGIGVRVDSGIYSGYTIPQEYDSLMSKLVVWAPNREASRLRMLRALGEYQIAGPSTTIPFDRAVLSSSAFVEGNATTTFIEDHMAELLQTAAGYPAVPGPAAPPEAPLNGRSFQVQVNRRFFRVQVAELGNKEPSAPPGPRSPRRRDTFDRGADKALVSPMHGTVTGIRKSPGELVAAGETVAVIEAMKMENEVPAHRSGILSTFALQVGDTVDAGQEICTIEDNK